MMEKEDMDQGATASAAQPSGHPGTFEPHQDRKIT